MNGEIVRLASGIREGAPVTDGEFDRVYPSSIRAISARFWTPVAVARRAAELLVDGSAARVLDVGAGAGKFCIVGALATGASFTGVEQRASLCTVARRAATALGAPRVEIVCGTLEGVDWRAYDAYYLFNPFAENLFCDGVSIDDTVTLGGERYREDVAIVEVALRGARRGTRVATYHGYGGAIPEGYRLIATELRGTGRLQVWAKER